MNDVIREFLLETQENLAQLDTDLVTLEKDPTERETLARVFRTLHSVKGTAGFIGLTKLQAVAHSAESLLSRIRAGELSFDRPVATATLSVVDAVRQILSAVEKDGSEGTGDYSFLIAELDRLREKAGHVAAPPKSLEAKVVVAPPPTVAVASQSLVTAPAEAPSDVRAAVTDTALRVDVGLLDKLMNLVGELVLARNQVMQFSSSQADTAFLGTVQRLNLLTTELQTNVMKTRMQPIGTVWGKFPRVVRDLAVACGKQVRLDTEGQETELDKTIIEAIRDPLTHIVRNAVDHGIESPEVRAKSGKPPEGRLFLHAYHEGGKVLIEVTDDGGGIDPHRVKEKAVRQKVIPAEDAARMSDRELVNLVFLPGFSTADKVTHFSGRGVGMDVVRTNIEKIGGTVDLDSRPSIGTTLRMKIPLTLAIIPALTVTSGGERFCIPQVSLQELVRLEAEGQNRVESFHGAPVYRLRENLLPLVYLDEHLGLAPKGRKRGDVHIVVLQADDRPFGLVVDAIHDTEEIVVKPLQKQLKGVSAFAGATIMGDGRVALILDVVGLAHEANVLAETRGRAAAKVSTDTGRSAVGADPLLIFATTSDERMAVPLALVSRLEEFPRASLERTGGREVVQYRDEILPLVDVAQELRRLDRNPSDSPERRQRRQVEPNREGAGPVPVVVTRGHASRVGLLVREILDVVDEAPTARSEKARPGVLFSAVVQGKVTEFLDVEAVIRAAVPDSEERGKP